VAGEVEAEEVQEQAQEQVLEQVLEWELELRRLYPLLTKNQCMVADKPILSFQSCIPKGTRQLKMMPSRENQVHSTIVGSKIAVSLVWY
jgi:hypothetical protein